MTKRRKLRIGRNSQVGWEFRPSRPRR